MSLISIALIGWVACTLGSALVFVWWSHVTKLRSRSARPIALHPTTVQQQDMAH